MTVLITMAGLGSRFSEAGYQVPKYRIRARGRTLFDWSLLSMRRFFDQNFIFACLADENTDWIIDAAHRLGIRRATVATRSALSAGQAETAYDALSSADPGSALWIYNIDTYVDPEAFDPGDMDNAVGCVPVFPSTEPNMSFVAYDSRGLVRRISEKQVISSWATVGLYGFASRDVFSDLYRRAYMSGEIALVGGERYIAPMYDLMLASGDRVVAPKLSGPQVHILGTPAQVLQFDELARPPEGH